MQVSDGVAKRILKEGTGPQVSAGRTVDVHCTACLEQGRKKFWSTKDPGQSVFSFKCGVGQVIKGWDEGCLTMRVGETAELTIAGYKGYGASGFPGWGIPPNATLIFEIEVLNMH